MFPGTQGFFSILEYNCCFIHFSVNLIAMFVAEMKETRCRYAGAMSEISGHDYNDIEDEVLDVFLRSIIDLSPNGPFAAERSHGTKSPNW